MNDAANVDAYVLQFDWVIAQTMAAMARALAIVFQRMRINDGANDGMACCDANVDTYVLLNILERKKKEKN